MVNINQIADGASGLFAMARGDEDWDRRMDMSPKAVFASFWALPLAIPMLILAHLAVRNDLLAEGSVYPLLSMPPLPFALLATLSGITVWLLVLAGLAFLTPKVTDGWRVSPVIIAQNYSGLIGYTIIGLSYGSLHLAGWGAYSGYLGLPILMFAIWLDWGILRRGMGLAPFPTAGVILLVQFFAILVDNLIETIALGFM